MFLPSRARILKSISLGLLFVLFASHSALPYAPETNFWSERKKQARKATSPVQLAALPKPSRLAPAIPQQLGAIRSISTAAGKSDSPVVLHIQDIHRNTEAQTNISQTLQYLISNELVDLVALEGAFSEFDFRGFRQFDYPDAVKAVADYFFKEKKITGPVYTAFTSPAKIPPYIGIDDEVLYTANVNAYKKAATQTGAAKEKWMLWRRNLNEQKNKTLNPLLKELDHKVDAYRQGTLPMGPYLRHLAKTSEASFSPMIELFLEALHMEDAIRFQEVRAERENLLTQLIEKLDENQTAVLMEKSKAYRAGRVGHADFYQALQTLCEDNGIRLTRFPAMNAYIQYLVLSDRIEIRPLFNEMKQLEEAAYDALIKNDQEKKLIKESRHIYLTGKLLDFALTPEEWQEYKSLKIENSLLNSFINFYIYAEQRDHAMASNLLAAMKRHNAKTAVLVTGGFHSPGMNAQLSKEGITTLTFSPKITKVESETGSTYLSVFTQEKTPLDQIFDGRQLFVSQLTQLNWQPLALASVVTAQRLSDPNLNPMNELNEMGHPVPSSLEVTHHKDESVAESETSRTVVSYAGSSIQSIHVEPSGEPRIERSEFLREAAWRTLSSFGLAALLESTAEAQSNERLPIQSVLYGGFNYLVFGGRLPDGRRLFIHHYERDGNRARLFLEVERDGNFFTEIRVTGAWRESRTVFIQGEDGNIFRAPPPESPEPATYGTEGNWDPLESVNISALRKQYGNEAPFVTVLAHIVGALWNSIFYILGGIAGILLFVVWMRGGFSVKEEKGKSKTSKRVVRPKAKKKFKFPTIRWPRILSFFIWVIKIPLYLLIFFVTSIHFIMTLIRDAFFQVLPLFSWVIKGPPYLLGRLWQNIQFGATVIRGKLPRVHISFGWLIRIPLELLTFLSLITLFRIVVVTDKLSQIRIPFSGFIRTLPLWFIHEFIASFALIQALIRIPFGIFTWRSDGLGVFLPEFLDAYQVKNLRQKPRVFFHSFLHHFDPLYPLVQQERSWHQWIGMGMIYAGGFAGYFFATNFWTAAFLIWLGGLLGKTIYNTMADRLQGAGWKPLSRLPKERASAKDKGKKTLASLLLLALPFILGADATGSVGLPVVLFVMGLIWLLNRTPASRSKGERLSDLLGLQAGTLGEMNPNGILPQWFDPFPETSAQTSTSQRKRPTASPPLQDRIRHYRAALSAA